MANEMHTVYKYVENPALCVRVYTAESVIISTIQHQQTKILTYLNKNTFHHRSLAHIFVILL